MSETRTGRKFSALFALQLAYLVLYPYGQQSGLPYLAFRIFGAALTILSLYAVSFRRLYLSIGLILAVPAFLQRIFLSSPAGGGLLLTGNLLGFAFDAFIVAVIFHRVFFEDDPTREAIFGALCIYLLMGFSFSSIFGMLTKLQPSAFYLDPAINVHSTPDRFDLIYYSFATLTCLGASGISPVTSEARSVSVIESLAGILYIAVLISRLLNAYHTSNIRNASRTDQ
jgi:hypothetical protein